VRSASAKGPLGFPLIDVKAEVYDGKDHPVDSKDIAFQIAAAEAFKEACAQAKPALLEPIALVKVRVPDRYTGDVISDLNGRRGRILGMDSEGSVSVISAHVPMSELQSYSADLRSMTGGRGAFSLALRALRPGARAAGRPHHERGARGRGDLSAAEPRPRARRAGR
jgi:elongation factor G